MAGDSSGVGSRGGQGDSAFASGHIGFPGAKELRCIFGARGSFGQLDLHLHSWPHEYLF